MNRAIIDSRGIQLTSNDMYFLEMLSCYETVDNQLFDYGNIHTDMWNCTPFNTHTIHDNLQDHQLNAIIEIHMLAALPD